MSEIARLQRLGQTGTHPSIIPGCASFASCIDLSRAYAIKIDIHAIEGTAQTLLAAGKVITSVQQHSLVDWRNANLFGGLPQPPVVRAPYRRGLAPEERDACFGKCHEWRLLAHIIEKMQSVSALHRAHLWDGRGGGHVHAVW